ncbi:cytochrome b5 reductase 4-like isoform X1 [Pectinophora gossypiella]|nr:cytochrome b5 reductase 4-like isoform X1 [Pectinophora gossypiella]XP_049871977.1 cytochrome b5 reductase 4-like isoform X1 [Pectinophora gossypiella]
MADPQKEDETTPTQNGTLKISLPTVLEPSSEKSDISVKSFVTSESKLSLPSNLCTPTSPLRLSSPLSLPCSPTPFTKTLQAPEKTTNSLSSSTKLNQQANNQSTLNTGSATGNPRNKCALQPGHSLMDWIRLGNSGKDLTGVGGRVRPVSPAELAAHNTQKDAWLAIRGRVYNITHYLPYHPGGPEELMRGAGMDATQLFDKVHPWVNYDSLLAKCLIGPLRFDLPEADEIFDSNPSPKSDRLREPSKAQELVRKSMENLANCITPVRKRITSKSDENVKGNSPPSKIMQSLIQSSDLPVSISRRAASSPVKTAGKTCDLPPSLRYDWIQTSTKLTISVYTGPLANPGGCARIHDGVLLIEVATDGWLRTIKLVPEAKLQEPLQLRTFTESGKIEVIAQKEEAGVWKSCGEAALGTPTKVSSPRTVECRVVDVGRVSHDTLLLAVTPRAGPVVVPLGSHVCVHRRIAGSDVVRSYTPVGEGWGPGEPGALKLAVKRYEGGVVSPELAALKIGDLVKLSGPYGNFHLQKLKSVRAIYFIVAGTGITPMLGILKFMLARSNPKCERVHLLFFNKTEEDILFRDKFEEIAKEDNRLIATHVLSEPSTSWSGYKGRIRSDLLTEVIGKMKCSGQCTHFACLCGPIEFTHNSLDLLGKHGMKDNCIHAFMG